MTVSRKRKEIPLLIVGKIELWEGETFEYIQSWLQDWAKTNGVKLDFFQLGDKIVKGEEKLRELGITGKVNPIIWDLCEALMDAESEWLVRKERDDPPETVAFYEGYKCAIDYLLRYFSRKFGIKTAP